MSNKVTVKVSPKRVARAERKKAKFIQRASEELRLRVLAGEFHKAYLEIELGCEQEKFEALEARLAELQPKVEVVETVETVEETVVAPEGETDNEEGPDVFDTM